MLAASLAVPAMAFGMASFDFPVVAPVVIFVAGDVTIKGAGATDWDPAEIGRLLASGDTVRTDPSSKAEISCATGKMRLYENTVIIVPEVIDEGDKSDIRSVTLDDGAGLFRIKKRGVERGFEVKTSNGYLFIVWFIRGMSTCSPAVSTDMDCSLPLGVLAVVTGSCSPAKSEAQLLKCSAKPSTLIGEHPRRRPGIRYSLTG